jgi:hypothetical protein
MTFTLNDAKLARGIGRRCRRSGEHSNLSGAPWPLSQLALGFADQQRLDTVARKSARCRRPPSCGGGPTGIPRRSGDVVPGWLAAWARDRAVYRMGAPA